MVANRPIGFGECHVYLREIWSRWSGSVLLYILQMRLSSLSQRIDRPSGRSRWFAKIVATGEKEDPPIAA
jgi:hypothetical protein